MWFRAEGQLIEDTNRNLEGAPHRGQGKDWLVTWWWPMHRGCSFKEEGRESGLEPLKAILSGAENPARYTIRCGGGGLAGPWLSKQWKSSYHQSPALKEHGRIRSLGCSAAHGAGAGGAVGGGSQESSLDGTIH